jgi:hypothetical protein
MVQDVIRNHKESMDINMDYHRIFFILILRNFLNLTPKIP